MNKKWSKISLIFFFIVACIGTLLRSVVFFQIPFEYANLVHAHSHVAFQGWIYTIMILLLTKLYLEDDQIERGRYPIQFKCTVFVVVGILIAFSLQGYGLYSIIFSTIFQFLNYWFIYRFVKDTKHIAFFSKNVISLRFVKTGLGLGLLSTIVPYAIGILSAKGLAHTEFYRSMVYTFLHLQYNGWFLFVIIGILFKFLDNNNVSYSQEDASKFYWLFTIAVLPSISLSLLGMAYASSIMLFAYASAGLLMVALFYFLKIIVSHIPELFKKKEKWFQVYFATFVFSFSLKLLLQCFSVFSIFKSYAFNNKNIIIAYLHLSLIGGISCFILAMLYELKWIRTSAFSKIGTVLLLLGFATTELLLLLGGLNLYYDYTILTIGSAMMALGILFLIMTKVK